MILIDTSGVPPEKLTDPRLLGLKGQMQQALQNRKWVDAFCIHEAGHMIYLEKMGVMEFVFTGPRIEYDAIRDDYDGYMASVQAQTIPVLPDDADPLEVVDAGARAWAAGGVFTEKLTAAPDNGAQGDRELFNAICDAIEMKHSLGLDREQSWKQGREDVFNDLRSPAARERAWEKAHEIRSRFGF